MVTPDRSSEDAGRDRILPETKWLSAFIIPFLAIAFSILFFMPDQTDRRFAWPIGPQMTAMMLGSTYLTGIFYFSTVLFAKRWQHIKFGLIPVTIFASTLAVATALHWDRFTHDHIAFWLWIGLYATTPFIVFFVWLRNTRAAPVRLRHPDDVLLPAVARIAVGVVGATGLLASALLFIAPGVMIDVWPWTLSALTARTMAAVFAVFSAFAVGAYLDPRWESLRVLARSQLVSPLFFLIALLVSWDNFDTTNPLTWVFAFNVVVVFVIGVPAMYVIMETRRKGTMKDRTGTGG